MICGHEVKVVHWCLPALDEPADLKPWERVVKHAFVAHLPWIPLCKQDKGVQFSNKLRPGGEAPMCDACKKQVDLLRTASVWDEGAAKSVAAMLAEELEREHLDMLAWAVRHQLDTSSHRAMRQQLLDCRLSRHRVDAVLEKCVRQRLEPLREQS